MPSKPVGEIVLADVLRTAELAQRPARQPDYHAENLAMAALLKEMAASTGSIFQKLVDTALHLCHAGTAGLSLLDASGSEPVFRWPALAGQHAAYVGGTMPRHASPCGVVLDERAPQLFSNLGRFYPQLDLDPPFAEALLLPFFVDGQPVGTLWVIATDTQRHFDAEDARILGNLAELASGAVQIQSLSASKQAREVLELKVSQRTAELHEAKGALEARVAEGIALAERRTGQLHELVLRLEQCEYNERQKLAHVLHDDLQQMLAAAQMYLGSVRAQLKGLAAEASALKAQELIQHSIAASRTLTAELSPPGLQAGDLAGALAWLAEVMHEKHGITVMVEAQACSHKIPGPIARLVFQAVRELLFNTVKHASILEASVEAKSDADHQGLRVVVEDRGAGFNAQVRFATPQKGGFGVASIRERLESVGGGMTIESHEGQGTRTTLWVP